jgi:hypothetical protein
MSDFQKPSLVMREEEKGDTYRGGHPLPILRHHQTIWYGCRLTYEEAPRRQA